MIVDSVSESSIKIFDCNTDGKCTVKNYTKSFSVFKSDNIAFSLYRSKHYSTNISLSKPQIKSSWKANGMNSITIEWGAVSGAKSYIIERRKKIAGSVSDYTVIEKAFTGTSYTDTGLETASMYYYKVTAVNGKVKSARSDSCRVWTRSRAPVCTILGSSSVKISWTPVEFAETYRIDRRVAGDNTEYVTIKTGLKTTTFTDNGVSPNTPYYYRVYPVGTADMDHITVRSETSAKVKTPAVYTLDLNGYLGTNKAANNISGYGTADVYINGKLAANDVTDYNQKLDEGTAYEIKDIKAASGKYYYGITEGAASGSLKGNTSVRLHFGTMCTDGTRIIPDGEYAIAAATDPTKVLDVADGGTEDGTNLQLSTYKKLKNQIFSIKYMGGGHYSISDTNGGLSVHVQGSGTTDKTNVHMWKSITGYNGQWVIKKTADGNYNLITHCSSMYMDLPNGATAEGTNIQIYTGNGTNAQKFKLIQVRVLTGIQVEPEELLLQRGESQRIRAEVSPADAIDKTVKWSSSNTKVATVDGSGNVTGVSAGSAEISAVTEDGGYRASCRVNVAEPFDSSPDYVLPAGVKKIEAEAFAGLTMKSVRCPEGLQEIGDRAFSDCRSLTKIYIPASVEEISETAFAGCPDGLVFYGEQGSFAEEYAKKRGLVFCIMYY